MDTNTTTNTATAADDFDYTQVGDTREVNGIRIHLYHGSVEVTDLRDAGRRGRTCRRANAHEWPGVSRTRDLANVLLTAVDFDAALATMRATGLEMREETLRAVDVTPAADAPLTVVFRFNGIQVNGALVKGWFSHSKEWTDGARVIPEHVTFYADSLHSEMLRRVLPGDVENNTDTQTDYFEHDRVRFNVGSPRYEDALRAAKARSDKWAANQAKREAKAAARRAATGF